MPVQPEASALFQRVSQALVEDVNPALGLDGGGLELLALETGVARIRMAQGCSACPATLMTLILGIEEILRRKVPEVDYVELVP